MEDEIIHLSGSIRSLTHPTPGSDFALTTIVDRFGNGHTVVGEMSDVGPGDRVDILAAPQLYNGREQLKVISYFSVTEQYLQGVHNYIQSPEFKGIGSSYAQAIVDNYGTDAIDVFENETERAISGLRYFFNDGVLKEERYEALLEGINNNRDISHLASWLMQFSDEENRPVTLQTCRDIFDLYGFESVKLIQKNPYALVALENFGFKRADAIAKRLGIPEDSAYRLVAALHYTLKKAEYSGHTCLSKKYLINKTMEVLDWVQEEPDTGDYINDPSKQKLVENALAYALNKENPSLYSENGYVYHGYMLNAEKGVANAITSIIHFDKGKRLQVKSKLFSNLEKEMGIKFTTRQKDAVKMALENNISIITGGPGTGKTTTLNAVKSALYAAGYSEDDITMLAPTGKAAKRMAEQTKHYASTIHRALIAKPEKEYEFEHNQYHPLFKKAFIVDETSMIDIRLADALLKAVPSGAKVVFIGDPDQLPPVGQGQFFKDLLSSGVIPITRLDVIHRQGAESSIVSVSGNVRDSLMPDLSELTKSPEELIGHDSDFTFCEVTIPKEQLLDDLSNDNHKNEATAVADETLKVIREILPKMGFSQDDTQVLCPHKLKDNPSGTDALNQVLREYYNPDGESITLGRREYRVGDRMILNKNLSSENVYNGDTGVIRTINKEENTISVDFGDNIVEFDKESSLNLLHGYSITVHKSQGSEYPCVVIPIHRGDSIMLQRNLLYTALTRGKKKVILVGTKAALEYAVKNNYGQTRIGLLQRRLKENNKLLYTSEQIVDGSLHQEKDRSQSFLSSLFGIKKSKPQITPAPPAADESPATAKEFIKNAIRLGIKKSKSQLPPIPSAATDSQAATMEFLKSAIEKAGLKVNFVKRNEVDKELSKHSGDDAIRFTGHDIKFYEVAADKGIVNSDLAKRQINIVNANRFDLPDDNYDLSINSGVDSFIKDKIVGNWVSHKNEPREFFYSLPYTAIKNKLKIRPEKRAQSPEFRAKLLRALPSIISNSIDVEAFIPEINGPDGLMHRLVGCVRVDRKIYRVQMAFSAGADSFHLYQADACPIGIKITGDTVSGLQAFDKLESFASPGKLLLDASPETLPQSANQFAGFVNELSSHRENIAGRQYGWVDGNEIYITEDGLNPYTQIKQYTHLWAKSIQLSKPELWERVVDIVKKTKEWEDVNRATFLKPQFVNKDYLIAEALSIRSAKQNEDVIKGLLDDQQTTKDDVINDFWESIGLTSAPQRISEVTSMILQDLISGKQLFSPNQPSESIVEKTKECPSDTTPYLNVTNTIKGRSFHYGKRKAQLDLIGRCEETIYTYSGEVGCVQRVGDELLFQPSASIVQRIDGVNVLKDDGVRTGFIVDGNHYYPLDGSVESMMRILCSGPGVWVKDAGGNHTYLAFSIEKQGLIVTDSFDTALRKSVASKQTQADKDSQLKPKTPKKGKGVK